MPREAPNPNPLPLSPERQKEFENFISRAMKNESARKRALKAVREGNEQLKKRRDR